MGRIPDATPAAPVAFALQLPADWFELDVKPRTRDAMIRLLVDDRVKLRRSSESTAANWSSCCGVRRATRGMPGRNTARAS